MAWDRAVLHRRGIDHAAVLVLPGNRVAVLGCGECRRVARVARHGRDLRRPACEGVGVFCGCGLLRVGVGRKHAVLHSRRVDHAAVLIQPGNRIAVLRRGEGRGVARVAGHSNDLRRPAREAVSKLRGRRLRRVSMGRKYAVLHGRRVDHTAVITEPGDGELLKLPDRIKRGFLVRSKDAARLVLCFFRVWIRRPAEEIISLPDRNYTGQGERDTMLFDLAVGCTLTTGGAVVYRIDIHMGNIYHNSVVRSIQIRLTENTIAVLFGLGKLIVEAGGVGVGDRIASGCRRQHAVSRIRHRDRACQRAPDLQGI